VVLYLAQFIWFEDEGKISSLFHRFPREPVTLLVNFYWTQEGDRQIERIRKNRRRHLRRFPGHRIILLANSAEELRLFRKEGWESYWVNQNIFVDPHVFRPLPESIKRFDAVYDARLTPFKRHALAAHIGSLGLITYFRERYHSDAYVKSTRELLSHAHWFNNQGDNTYRQLSYEEINGCLNQCRVGLCLSAKEGAMFACVQYLLAGLPVVSTASIGGRDVFFDPEHVRLVENKPEAVAEAVQELIKLNLPAATVRRKTLERMDEHKNTLFHILQEIMGVRDWPSEWETWLKVSRESSSPRTTRTFIHEINQNA
jgi:glycosyltransferase involved in cell wall biosynthesis